MRTLVRKVSTLTGKWAVFLSLICGVACDQTRKQESPSTKKAAEVKAAPQVATHAPPEGKKTRPEIVADLRARHPSLFEDTPEDENELEPFSDFEITEQAEAMFEREVSLARKQLAQEEYESAISHFDTALSTGKRDARALSERGYAKWLLKKVPQALEDFWSAAGESAQKEIRAQIWYNLGLVFEHRGDTEMSRAAFAVSLALAPSAPARTKLGGRSTCQSSIKFGPTSEDVPHAGTSRGWLGVHERLGIDGQPSTEAEAKNLVCHAVSTGRGGPPEDAEGMCSGCPPYALSCCSGMGGFMAREMDIVPLADNQFFSIDHGMVGGWPRGCQGVARPDLSVEGSFAVVRTDASDVFPNGDFNPETVPGAKDGEYSGDPPCRRSPREKKVTIYRLSDAKRLLEVRAFSQPGPSVVIREKEKRIEVTGDGCDALVPF